VIGFHASPVYCNQHRCPIANPIKIEINIQNKAFAEILDLFFTDRNTGCWKYFFIGKAAGILRLKKQDQRRKQLANHGPSSQPITK
jgi:hypothetical protein